MHPGPAQELADLVRRDFHGLDLSPGDALRERRTPEDMAETLGLEAASEDLHALYSVLFEQYAWRAHPREDLMRYLRGHAAELGIDPHRIAVGGG